jgi:hypothetical protein
VVRLEALVGRAHKGHSDALRGSVQWRPPPPLLCP